MADDSAEFLAFSKLSNELHHRAVIRFTLFRLGLVVETIHAVGPNEKETIILFDLQRIDVLEDSDRVAAFVAVKLEVWLAPQC